MPLRRRSPLIERVSFGIVRIYYEDIEEIVNILAQVASSVRLQADDFVATEARDLLDMPSNVIDRLQIVATQPSVTVTLSSVSAVAEATDADMGTLGALKRIEELMRQRRRAMKRFVWPDSSAYSAVASLLAAVVGTVFALGTVLTNAVDDVSGQARYSIASGWFVGLAVLLGVACVAAIMMGARRRAVVVPRPQKEAPPFWERNRDQVLINAVFALIGGGLGVLGTLLLQWLSRE